MWMRNADYWKERMRVLEEARNASNGKLAARLEREFDGAMREIEDKISGWYRRLAKNNEVTLSEAKRLLKDGELKEFRWTVEEYIRHGEENGLRRNWAKELENASARVHINRLEALKIELRGIIERLGGSQEKQTKAHLADQYADTVYRTMFEMQNGIGAYWNTAKVSEKQIETVLSKPWTADRRTFSDRIWLDKDGLLDEVYKQLTRNVMLGRGPDASIKAIAKRFDASKYNAGRLVMTESAYVSAEADGHVYQELDVEQFEVDAALDGTTCGVCGDMDGRHFPRSEYQPGLNAPPFHPNCRCTTVPYIDDDIQRELDAKAGRAARNPETGKTEIVDDMTYADWKKMHVVKVLTAHGVSGTIITKNGIRVNTNSGHALERALERGVAGDAITDALKNPLFVSGKKVDALGRRSVRYIGENATVNINPDTGVIATVWKTGTAAKKKYRKGGADGESGTN